MVLDGRSGIEVWLWVQGSSLSNKLRPKMAELTANITGAAFRPFNCSFPLWSFHPWCHLTTGCFLILAILKWMLLHFCGSAFSLRYTLSHGEGLCVRSPPAFHSDMERGRWLEEWLSSPYMGKVLRGSMADVSLKSELRYWEQKWRQEFSLHGSPQI